VAIESGQQLLHYRLIEKIGEGGMGVVWKAEDTKLGRQIALKVLPETMAADPERRARFEREARAVAALNHPNIVTLYSVEEADPSTSSGQAVHFITMELVEGRTLTQLLPKNGFPLSRLLEIGIPLADAVSRAHRAGITHRDLKPDNIMIDVEGRLRVLDFGLAKLQEPAGTAQNTQAATVTSDTAEGRVLGTVAYMSPEQAEGKEVDARSDIFSLGTILYEMASGTRPFRGETTMSTLSAILKDQPFSITDLKPSLPRHAGRIIRRSLTKDPERRYQTALDLRNELEELKSEIDSGTSAAQARGTTSASRRSRIPMLIGAVVVTVIAVVFVAQLRNRGERPETEYQPRPVTATSSAWDTDPNWSPDGKFIAFERMSSGHVDIYVKPIDGGDAFLRAGGPGDQYAPRWTPDGRYLAYISKHEPGSWVYLMPSDGGKSTKLIATNIPTLDTTPPMGDRPWSIDGETLLVSIFTEAMQLAVHRVRGASGEAEQITFPPAGGGDSQATYSFDGRRILFLRQIEGRVDLMLMPAEGGDREAILHDEPGLQAVAWRPDNRHVVFQSRRGANANIFEIDIVTREERRLTNDTRSIKRLSVSQDDRIAYSPFSHNQFLYVADVETGERVQITSHALDNRNARFSPDGRTVAYVSNRTGNHEIWLHHRDGRPETRFTDDEGEDWMPEWSPDGRKILFASDREGGNFKLFVANADGGTEPRLLTEQATRWGPGSSLFYNPLSRWSPDGELIAYRVVGDEGPELWTVRPDGLDARKRLEGVTGFDWYRNSRLGLITRRRGTEVELLAVDLEDRREEPLFVGALLEIDVAPDGSAVAFCYGRGHNAMGLAVLRLETLPDPNGLPRVVGEPQYVVPTEGTWHVHNGGWSPDSTKLVYTQDQDYGDIYELVEKR
jgi:serine/threonine protein kinase